MASAQVCILQYLRDPCIAHASLGNNNKQMGAVLGWHTALTPNFHPLLTKDNHLFPQLCDGVREVLLLSLQCTRTEVSS